MNLLPAPCRLVPPGATTVMYTGPADCAGDTAVIWVPDTTVKLDAGTVPNITADTSVNPVPVMVTEVPPAVGPAAGETCFTVGRAR